MRVLVTGVTGFVGYAVAALLVEHGHQVDGLTRSATADLPGGVRRVRGDLTRADTLAGALAGVEGVCHLAGRTRVRESWADPLGYWYTNVGGTLAVLAGMRAAGTRRLVLASTCAVYSKGADQPISETAPVAPGSPYGRGKLAADQAATDLATAGALGAVSLRSFNIAGALHGRSDRDDTRLIPRLLAAQHDAAGSQVVINGDGGALRDFVHVADMAAAFSLALGACEPGLMRVYNIGSGRASSVNEVIAMVEAITGRPVARRYAPAALEPQRQSADPTLIQTELGWHPARSSLREIISDAWAASTSH